MPLVPGHIQNFETLRRAVQDGNVALVECRDSQTALVVPVLCALSRDVNGEVALVPLAQLFTGNPNEHLQPPDPDDPTGFAPLAL